MQALAAGNAVVLKPGIGGSRAATALRAVLIRAGMDPSLLMILPEEVESARAAIEACPDKVIFTGSAAAGVKVLEQLAARLIPSVMELSGCDAMIVRHDANLDLLVGALKFGLRLNDGATCLAPRRLLVDQGITTEVEGRLARAFPANLSFPLINAQARMLVDEALGQGAHFIAGGRSGADGLQTPAILGGVKRGTRLLREDLFAPVLAMMTVSDDEDAVARANECPYALGTSIFSGDETAGRELASRVNCGVVTINDLIIPSADARLPFGGCKRSGFGITRGAEGLLELSRPKVLTLSRGNSRRAFGPAKPSHEKLFEFYLRAFHGRGWMSLLSWATKRYTAPNRK